MGFFSKLTGVGAALGPALAGAGIDYLGQREARKADVSSAREQMEFQRSMSSTAHQRQVADLRAAGLNPALSANSGASTPAGAGYDGENLFGGFGGSVSSALSIRSLKKDIELKDANIRNIDANTDATRGGWIPRMGGTDLYKYGRDKFKRFGHSALEDVKTFPLNKLQFEKKWQSSPLKRAIDWNWPPDTRRKPMKTFKPGRNSGD